MYLYFQSVVKATGDLNATVSSISYYSHKNMYLIYISFKYKRVQTVLSTMSIFLNIYFFIIIVSVLSIQHL